MDKRKRAFLILGSGNCGNRAMARLFKKSGCWGDVVGHSDGWKSRLDKGIWPEQDVCNIVWRTHNSTNKTNNKKDKTSKTSIYEMVDECISRGYEPVIINIYRDIRLTSIACCTAGYKGTVESFSENHLNSAAREFKVLCDFHKRGHTVFVVDFSTLQQNPALYIRMFSTAIDFPLDDTFPFRDVDTKHYEKFRDKQKLDVYKPKDDTVSNKRKKTLPYNEFLKQCICKTRSDNKTPLRGQKAYRIYQVAMRTQDLEGCTAEVGVFGGVTTRMIAEVLGRKHYAYDTYEGILGADETKGDKHKDGQFYCSLEDVKNYVGENDNIEYVVGMFPDTFKQENEKFVFVHSDTDTYMGTKTSIEKFWPLIVSGGYLVIDDYNWRMTAGVTRACEEFIKQEDTFATLNKCESSIAWRHEHGCQLFLQKR